MPTLDPRVDAYTDGIVEAKKAQTREKRLAQAVEWMAEGKRRNWKYGNC